ncbi:MAG: sulfur carrier protein ThiS [Candidatus Sulfotelmatobacter sp.]
MKLHINGKESILSGDAVDGSYTLAALVESLGMKPDRVAVELNRKIIARDRWLETTLSEDDRLEIVQFVGGG